MARLLILAVMLSTVSGSKDSCARPDAFVSNGDLWMSLPLNGLYDPSWDGTATTCTLIGLEDYTGCAFVLRACDDQGHESADSDEVWLAGLIAPPATASHCPGRRPSG